MGTFSNWITGRTARKISKTKRQVQDVQSLHKFKAGRGITGPEKQAATRAMGRTGDTGGAYTANSPKVR